MYNPQTDLSGYLHSAKDFTNLEMIGKKNQNLGGHV